MSRRATAAIWVACLAGGVGIGVLTDGGIVVSGRSDRTEPASEGTNVDAAGWRPPASHEASGGSGTSRESPEASSVRAAGDGGAGEDRSDALAGGSSRRVPHRSRRGGLDERDAEAILEGIVPGVVIPPLDGHVGQPGQPGGSTTTTEPPSTTTTSDAPTTTASSVPPDPGGGSGPIITPLQPGRNP